MTNNPCRLLLFTAAMIGALRAAPPVIGAVDERMESFVESKEIAGTVTLVADAEKILHLSASDMRRDFQNAAAR